LKDEINAKDHAIHEENFNRDRYATENAKLKADIDRISRHIDSSEEMIKT
jgi:hypothetical protein